MTTHVIKNTKIKSITMHDGRVFKVGECTSIDETERMGISGYRIELKCTSDNELTIANSHINFTFISALNVIEVQYQEERF